MQTLLVSRRHDAVLEVTLNRPAKKNAVNSEMWAELAEVLRHAREDRSVRVLVLGGAGGAFCSGADLSDTNLGGSDTLSRMRSINEVALLLHHLPKPTIAKVSGIAAGAGCNLALGCDIIIAGDSARFSEIFVRRGLSVDFGGSFLLPRLIGMHKAKELAFTGEIIDAAGAKEIGLVNRVVSEDELEGVVAELAARLAEGAPIAIGLTKALLNESLSRSMEEALEAEALSQTINGKTTDAREAISAFLEKRAPYFVGE